MTLPARIQETILGYYRLLDLVKEAGGDYFLDPGMALMLVHMGDRPWYHDRLRATGLFGSNMTYALDRLEARGYITGKTDSTDKRRRVYARTEAGADIASAVLARLERA